jgi:peptidoglycan/xylan/chitin deacetylase (PgdA/CDA1 family)
LPFYAYIQTLALVGSVVGVLAVLVWLAVTPRLRPAIAILALVWFGCGLLAAHLFLERIDLSRRTLARLRRGQRRLALTFDDGPNLPLTARILAVLARYDVRATFFLVGEHVRHEPEVVRQMVAAGHAVGNHGLSHSKLTWASRSVVEREIEETQRLLHEAGAVDVRLFRAPHGFKSLLWGRVLDRHGLRLCAWTRGVWDTDRPGTEIIARRVLRGLSDGEIVLLHDGGLGADRVQTAEALERIVPECLRRGFRFVTLPEALAEDEGTRS